MKILFTAMLAGATAAVSGRAAASEDVASLPLHDLSIVKLQAFPLQEILDNTTITRNSYAGVEEVWVVTREMGRARAMATFGGVPAQEIRTTTICRYGAALSNCRNGDTPVATERTWNIGGGSGGWFVVHAVAENDPGSIKMRMLYIK